MDQRTPVTVECKMHHPTLLVSDVKAAVDFYTNRLGFALGFLWGEPATTAGVNLDEVSIHLRLGAPSPAGCEIYFVVDDVDALHAYHVRNGVQTAGAPANRAWGMREYGVRDPDGHSLKFGQHRPADEPKLAIERVDLALRLEKRLAALLADLAEHKGMSVSACIEETLLHTLEDVEGGASPHSASTQAYIRALKLEHGIDYDAHAGYRFVER